MMTTCIRYSSFAQAFTHPVDGLPDLGLTSQEDIPAVEEPTSVWTRAPTLQLLDEYERKKHLLISGRLRKKVLWDQIAVALKDYHFTPDQVSGRWKTLCQNYKNVKDANKKSGM